MKEFVAPGDHERGLPTILASVKFDYVPGRPRAGAGSLGRWGIRQKRLFRLDGRSQLPYLVS